MSYNEIKTNFESDWDSWCLSVRKHRLGLRCRIIETNRTVDKGPTRSVTESENHSKDHSLDIPFKGSVHDVKTNGSL